MRRLTLTAAILAALLAAGCASFSGHTSLSPPYREPVFDTSVMGMTTANYVSVRVDHDREWSGRPWCDLPDASATVDCLFPISYLESLPMQGTDGYRSLTFSVAYEACFDALWSIGQTSSPAIVEACGRALVQYRWTEDLDYGVVDPSR